VTKSLTPVRQQSEPGRARCESRPIVIAKKDMHVELVGQRIESQPPTRTPGEYGRESDSARKRSDQLGIRLARGMDAL
jgi:hypothetical protein